MDLCISVFVYVGSIVLYKRIVNANTQSIRKEKVRRGFLTYRIAINRTTRGKPLRLQKTSFFESTSP